MLFHANRYLSITVCYSVLVASPHMRTEKACHAGSAAIKELLLRHDEWYHILRFPVSFDYVYEGITGSPMNPIRDDILCDFDSKFTNNNYYVKERYYTHAKHL
jgi:hypothetical protein